MIKERIVGHKFEKNDINFEFTEVTHFTGDVYLTNMFLNSIGNSHGEKGEVICNLWIEFLNYLARFVIECSNFYNIIGWEEDEGDADGLIKVVDFNH